MYGDIQSFGAYQVSLAESVELPDSLAVGELTFTVKGVRKDSDVVMTAAFKPTAPQPALANVVLGSGYVSADDTVKVPIVSDTDDFAITDAYVFDIVIGRRRSINSGALA